MNPLLPGVAILCTVVLGACGGVQPAPRNDQASAPGVASGPSAPPSRSSVTAHTQDPAGYDGPVAASISYTGMGVQLAPPPLGTVPGTSWQQAFGLCAAHAAVCGDYTTTPAIRLALVTTNNGATVEPDGSLRPTIDRELAYVMTWPSALCVPAGPPSASHQAVPCFFLTLVDANTGKFLGAGDSAGPDGP
jgi:hypothetical protein